MIITANKDKKRQATAAVELAVLLPFLFTLIYGIWEVGRLIQVSQVVSNSAREGARQASTGSVSSSTVGADGSFDVHSYVGYYIQNSGLPISGTITVTVTNETQNLSSEVTVTPGASPVLNFTQVGSTPTLDPAQGANQGDVLRVDVVYPYSPARWIPVNSYFTVGNVNIAATERWTCLRDLPIVVNSTIPSSPQ